MTNGIDILIVNYYSKEKLKHLLNSINESLGITFNLQVIIINNSKDDLLDDLTCTYNLIIINNCNNNGFGYACNQALNYIQNNYILLLNPDTVLFSNTLLESFLYLENNTDVTVLGVKHVDHQYKTMFSCSRFPTLNTYINDILGLSKLNLKLFMPAHIMTDWNHEDSRFVDQVMGAYLMIRQAFVSVHGFMDERYFVFLEDADLCKSVWNNGGKVFYNSGINIIHEGGNSTEGVSDKKLCYFMEGRLKYAYKYFDKWQYYILFLAIILVEPVTRCVFEVVKPNGSISGILRGYKLFYKRSNFK